MDLRNGKRKQPENINNNRKKRQRVTENLVDDQLEILGLKDTVEIEVPVENEEIQLSNSSNDNLNLQLDENYDDDDDVNEFKINEDDDNPAGDPNEDVTINSVDVSSLDGSIIVENDNFEHRELLEDSINTEPVFQSTQQDIPKPSFPDLKSDAFRQLKENLPFLLIKRFNSLEQLDTFFRADFPFIKFRHNGKTIRLQGIDNDLIN